MKAISIKQPWAWLICAGYKDIENRHWRIGRKSAPGFTRMDYGKDIQLPVRIYVHASKTIDTGAIENFLNYQGPCLPWQAVEFLRDNTYCETWITGAIIGEVDIIACVKESLSKWFEGPWGFDLRKPSLYEKPIPYRGQLGFFEVNIPVLNS